MAPLIPLVMRNLLKIITLELKLKYNSSRQKYLKQLCPAFPCFHILGTAQPFPSSLQQLFKIYLYLIFAELAGEPPPPPPDVAQHDLMMRLGLLLGNRAPSSCSQTSPISPPPGGQEDTSLSSMTSNEANADKTSDTSPISTLTGKHPGSERKPHKNCNTFSKDCLGLCWY